MDDMGNGLILVKFAPKEGRQMHTIARESSGNLQSLSLDAGSTMDKSQNGRLIPVFSKKSNVVLPGTARQVKLIKNFKIDWLLAAKVN